MRILPEPVRSELFAEHGVIEPDSLIDITLGGETRRFHANPNGRASLGVAGKAYELRRHQLSFPDDLTDFTLENSIVLDNADGRITEYFMPRTGIPPRGVLEHRFVFAPTPVDVVLGPFIYDVVRSEIDESRSAVIVHLAYDALLREPFPEAVYSPSRYPGLF